MVIVARRTPPSEMAARHNRVAAAMAAEEREARPRVANVRAALEAWNPRPLVYRGRRIPARPIAWDDGMRLLEAAGELERWGAEGGQDLWALRTLYRQVVDLCWVALRPRWMPRWAQRLRPNPFRRATEAELAEILGFAARCRTISLVGHRS